VPRALIERPKHGFSVPLAAWLRGPLRGWADDLLSAAGLRRGDRLEPEPIVARWREHRQRRRDWSQSLWPVLMLQTWLKDRGSGIRDQVSARQRSRIRLGFGS
jgi:asparagine synthase (glutamine-hydrolysing)